MTNKQVILIIEDEKNIGNYIETIVISNGYKALRAMNGMSGLSLCTSHHPDLILLDLGLPDIDGSEVLERGSSGYCDFSQNPGGRKSPGT